jgi:sugar O-acyltransferase (sialic acid O-acetyltransferase NeuD family)
MMPFEIIIPLVNPNEPEALLAGLHVREGEWVEADALICTLETTKSTAEVYAEVAGYFLGLSSQEGDTVVAGDLLGYLAKNAEWIPPERSEPENTEPHRKGKIANLRITDPALALAESLNIDLSDLPHDILITEKIIRGYIGNSKEFELLNNNQEFNDKSILIYGGGGHGKSVLELIKSLDTLDVVGFIDDGVNVGDLVLGVPVLGDKEKLIQLHSRGIRQAANAVGGIGNVRIRHTVFRRLIQAGFSFPTLVHPTAFVEPSASLAPGVQVFPLAYIGSEVEVGFGTIVNTGAVVSHECVLGDLVNISPGAILAGGVKVGEGTLIGMGVNINLQVRIGVGARVGNGAIVNADVKDGGVVTAGSSWPK